ncbi:MAG: orotate phosphoribosyltransferase [Firmicutes bacterium HGW-Firmicutes-1]|jgi:orotate phosphoribosyltransferase|nr:MAG: orotate phosphoribosyltransferase [Firmicutes bacterium HGW-Firmicutes-1]
MEQYKKDFIEFMVQCGVLTFGDFTTKSGRKTPFFVNTGNYRTGRQLSQLGDYYAKAIRENFGLDFQVLYGPAYKGIPLSVATSIALANSYGADVAYCSNRKEAKDHGEAGVLLGSKLKDGDKVIIIEDVTTAGTSIYETMPLLKEAANVEVLGLIISVDRMEKGKTNVSALNELAETFDFKTCSIVTMEEVIGYLHGRKIDGVCYIDDEIKERINDYYNLYGAK